jgi:hypothetical protein
MGNVCRLIWYYAWAAPVLSFVLMIHCLCLPLKVLSVGQRPDTRISQTRTTRCFVRRRGNMKSSQIMLPERHRNHKDPVAMKRTKMRRVRRDMSPRTPTLVFQKSLREFVQSNKPPNPTLETLPMEIVEEIASNLESESLIVFSRLVCKRVKYQTTYLFVSALI